MGGVADVITCAKFQIEIFMGYDFTGGRIFDFPIDFSMGLTTVQRYCAACDDVPVVFLLFYSVYFCVLCDILLQYDSGVINDDDSATSNNIKHWPLMGELLRLVPQEGDGAGPQPAQTVPNVTAHPSTPSVPITVLLYNVPLLCAFNVPVKGLISLRPCVRCMPMSTILGGNERANVQLIKHQ